MHIVIVRIFIKHYKYDYSGENNYHKVKDETIGGRNESK